MKKDYSSIPRKPASRPSPKDRKKCPPEDFNHDLRGTISELEAKLKRFQNLVENVDDVLVEIDNLGRVLYVTPNVETFSGYKPEELIGKIPTEFMPQEKAIDIYKYFLELVSRGENIEAMELNGVHKDGHHFVMEAYAVPYFDSKGQVLGYRGVARDITDRKRMEEQLRESRQDLNRAQAIAHIGSWRFNLRRNEAKYSDETYRILGIPPGTSMTYDSFLSVVHPEDREYVNRNWLATLNGDQYDIEHRIIAGETVKWVRGRAEREYNAQEELVGAFGTVQDITDRKQLEEELRESEERFRAFMNNSPAVSWIKDEQGRYIYLNENYKKILAVKLGKFDFTGKTDFELWPEKIAGKFWQNDMEVLAKNQKIEVIEQTQDEHGEKYWLSIKFPFQDASGRKYVAGTGIDMTNRIQNEDALRKARDELEDRVRERTAQLSEINKDLMSEIQERKRTETKLLSTQKNLRAVVSEIVFAEERSRQHFATDLHDTVVQTLGAAKMRAHLIEDQIPLNAQPMFADLQAMLSESIVQARSIMAEMSPPVLSELGFAPALEWLAEQFVKQHGMNIEFEIKSGKTELSHEVQVTLFQATRELLMNVLKHSKSRTAVVKFSGTGRNVKIEVRDSGTGFDMKKSLKPELDGGYGLFSIRERLRYIDGTLKIKSKPGQGTAVIISAPKTSANKAFR